MKVKYIQYFVEGEDEEKVIDALKTGLCAIRPGKTQKINVVQNKIKNARLVALRPYTMAVLVFDTDTGNVDILNENIAILKSCSAVSKIVTIPQVPNLEGELVRSCDIKSPEELLRSKSRNSFKSDLIRASNLASTLRNHQFDIEKFWSEAPASPFQNIENQANEVKL